MIARSRIVDGPVMPAHEAEALEDLNRAAEGDAGAAVQFHGIVRRMEPAEGAAGTLRPLAALDYTTYDPMADRELESLAESIGRAHGLSSIAVVHSRGRVPVGACSFFLHIRAPHRAEALRATESFIDRLKRDVPIWKSPVWE